jgi:HlyD family secretion protein
MTAKKRIALALLPLAAAAAALGWYVSAERQADTSRILVSGNIEVTDAEVSFKLSGLVKQRNVDEGQPVHQGDVVALLDESDLRCELEMRRAELAQAKAALAELEAGSRPEEIAAAEAAMHKAEWALKVLLSGSRQQEIKAAEAALSSAIVEEKRLAVEFERARQLTPGGAISQEQFDRAKAAYQIAQEKVKQAAEQLALIKEGPRQEEIEAARAALAQATAQYELVKKGPRQEIIDQARAKVEQAVVALRLAELRLGYATIRSPLSGMVIAKHIEPGEYVSPGTPIVTVGDLVNVWLRAYNSETDLGRVKLGQPAQVTTDGYPGKVYRGRVSFISSEAEFTPKNVQTEQERVKLVYRIKIDIPNPAMELKPGMPADAEILVHGAEESQSPGAR